MYQYLENNWQRWYYDDDPTQIYRTSNEQVWNVDFTLDPTPPKDLRTELIRACHSVRDTYPNEKLSLMLSGGSESEMMVRAFVEAGIPFDVYITRYSNDINIYDVSFAVTACENLKIPYTIIDFDHNKFFENEISEYSKHAEIYTPVTLAICAVIDKIDGVPIAANGDPCIMRRPRHYNTQPRLWCNVELESDYGPAKYFLKQNRPAITDFFRWNHRLLKSITTTKWWNNLINDKIPGKLGTQSSKIHGYREVYPELILRDKRWGMESILPQIEEIEKRLKDANNRINYEQAQLDSIELIYYYGKLINPSMHYIQN
jgi:hypothetical protein